MTLELWIGLSIAVPIALAAVGVFGLAWWRNRHLSPDIRRRRCPTCQCESVLSWRGYLTHLRRCAETRRVA